MKKSQDEDYMEKAKVLVKTQDNPIREQVKK